jgi:hypothetical protein
VALVFYINLPFGAVAMGLIATGLVNRPRTAGLPIDYAGLTLFTIASPPAGQRAPVVGSCADGADVVGHSRWPWRPPFLRDRAAGGRPFVPLRLFGRRMVAAAVTGFRRHGDVQRDSPCALSASGGRHVGDRPADTDPVRSGGC